MTKIGYHIATGFVFLVALTAAAVMWIQADRVYAAGNRVSGWRIGTAGLALPAVSLLACAVWLRWERGHGRTLATVGWLKGALVISALGWLALVLFSLM